MKKGRLGEKQIAFILKQAEDGTTATDACRKVGYRSKPVIDGEANMADLSIQRTQRQPTTRPHQ